MSLPDLAKQYVAAGLSVLPIKADGSKAPAVREWKTFQGRFPDTVEIAAFPGTAGIAVIAGAVSGNLEVLDFDDAETFASWAKLVEDALGPIWFSRLLIVKTPRPGFHAYMRCAEITGNSKLAQKRLHGAIKTLIETRGEGGYVLAPGSPGACHETGGTYAVVQGAFGSIPQVTPDERETLWSCARSLNDVWRIDDGASRELHDADPGTAFCAKATWYEVLNPHRFRLDHERDGEQFWTRPGKKAGVSATTNHNGNGLLYVFSSNMAPLDPERGYNKFGVYCLLNHGGKFHEAAAALRALGYGESKKQPAPAPKADPAQVMKPGALIDRLMSLWDTGLEPGADPGWPCVRELWTVRRREWTLVTGIPNHGKSNFCDALMVNLARRCGWKWAVYSAENLPHELHLVNLIEQYVGKPFHKGMHQRASKNETAAAVRWINDYFRFLTPEEDCETLPVLMALADLAECDGFLADPWNELSHDYAGLTEPEYINRQLKMFGKWTKKTNRHGIIVAHPAKMRKEPRKDGSMGYPMPSPYDVSGAAHWRNKPDNCLCMWRDEGTPGKSLLLVQKVRRRFVGRIGAADLDYDVVTGRYSDPAAPRMTEGDPWL